MRVKNNLLDLCPAYDSHSRRPDPTVGIGNGNLILWMMKGETMFIRTLKTTLIMAMVLSSVAMVLSSVGVKVVDAGKDEADAPEAKKKLP